MELTAIFDDSKTSPERQRSFMASATCPKPGSAFEMEKQISMVLRHKKSFPEALGHLDADGYVTACGMRSSWYVRFQGMSATTAFGRVATSFSDFDRGSKSVTDARGLGLATEASLCYHPL